MQEKEAVQIENVQPHRILGKIIGQEISVEEMEQVAGGDGNSTKPIGMIFIDRTNPV